MVQGIKSYGKIKIILNASYLENEVFIGTGLKYCLNLYTQRWQI